MEGQGWADLINLGVATIYAVPLVILAVVLLVAALITLIFKYRKREKQGKSTQLQFAGILVGIVVLFFVGCVAVLLGMLIWSFLVSSRTI
jgi:hypothetical protein